MLTHFLEKRSYWTRFWTVQDCFLALTAHLCFVVSLFGALEEIFTSHSHALLKPQSSPVQNGFCQSPARV